jgi:hypothetical protein
LKVFRNEYRGVHASVELGKTLRPDVVEIRREGGERKRRGEALLAY